MFSLKAIEEAEKMVKRILSDRVTETADLQEQVKAEAAAIAKANEAMEAATTAGDVEAYKRAKKDRQDAFDAKEMHENRIKALKEKPLISKTEYEKTVSAIYAEIAAADDQAKAALAKLSNEMNEVSNNLREAINSADDVLQRLQHDVFRDADRTHNPKTGELMPFSYEEKQIKNWNTVHWGKAGVKDARYRDYTGREAE